MLLICSQKSSAKKRNNSLTTYPEKEVNGNFSPKHHSRDDRNGVESFQERFVNFYFHSVVPRLEIGLWKIVEMSLILKAIAE